MLLSKGGVRHSWPADKPSRRPHTVPWCFTQQHRGVLSFKTCAGAVRTPSEHHQANGRTSDPAGSSAFPPAELPQQDHSSTLIVVFRWPKGLGGNEVSVVGSFNGWSQPLVLGRSPETGDFVRSLSLPPGTHQYKFLVDTQWRTSAADPLVTDQQTGLLNNQQMAAHNATFHWRGSLGGTEVCIAGDFNAWAELLPLRQDPQTGDWVLPCSLQPGAYAYQFLVDGQWRTSPDAPVDLDGKGHLCNRMSVGVPEAFQIFYATGWNQATVLYRVLPRAGQAPAAAQGWQHASMFPTASRAKPGGGSWLSALIPVPSAQTPRNGRPEGLQLEFYVEGEDGQEDRPSGGSTYLCPSVGAFKLRHGQLRPFPQPTAAPTMLVSDLGDTMADSLTNRNSADASPADITSLLPGHLLQVSDLDGTMVGTTPEADEMTSAFTRYWEGTAALCNSVLVYNTGRSLGQFKGLLQEKAGVLAVPDALITAVGTKIFLLDTEGNLRGGCSGQAWVEDGQWNRVLDEGWDLGRVKQVAEQVVSQHGSDGAVHWLDHGTEHPHRIALSVRSDKVQVCMRQLSEGLKAHGVQVRLILSGFGEWRYLDCVSIRAGKQEALEYVRQLFNVPVDRCMAAGDSGNDTLMLAGEHKAIIVGNAQMELLDWLMEQPQSARAVYTDAPMARGILEGIARHGLY